MSSLRVSFVPMSFPALSETFISTEVGELVRRGFDVRVHSLRPKDAQAEALRAQRGLQAVKTTYMTARSWQVGAGLFLREPQLFDLIFALFRHCWRQPYQFARALVLLPRAAEILAEIRSYGPDVVHLSWAHFPVLVGYLVQRCLPDVQLSIAFRAYDIDASFGLTRVVAQRDSLVQTISTSNIEDVKRRFGVREENIHVIRDGIDPEVFELPFRKVPGRIVSGGRLVRSKGMEDVVRAFAQIHLQCPSATLEIFGDGEDRSRLTQIVRELGLSDRVTFLGFQTPELVAETLARAEVFLFLSPSERLSNVIKEAMAAGCASVAYKTHGVHELIPDERTGAVIDVGDVPGAVSAALRYLRDAELRTTTSLAARRFIRDNFSKDRSIDQLTAVWRAGLAASGRKNEVEVTLIES